MSLAIDVDRVSGVLLADGWHEVGGRSFGMDAYEYLWFGGWERGTMNYDHCPPDREPPDPIVFEVGKYTSYLGFEFTDDKGQLLSGPVTAILAVRQSARADETPVRSRSVKSSKGPARRPIPMRLRFGVMQRDKFRCVYCGAKPDAAELQLDHVVPYSQGGADTIENLVTACPDCNNGRGTRPVERES